MNAYPDRYIRQTSLPEIGPVGQDALARARVLIVGIGGLGSPILFYLTAAGVGLRGAGGCIGAMDGDIVQPSNLQRQILFHEKDCGLSKMIGASKRVAQLNHTVDFRPIDARLTPENALAICRDYDILVDGTDNFETKDLINTVAVQLKKPMVYGSVFGIEGQAATFWAQQGPCYRCLYPTLPKTQPDRVEFGVVGGIAGMVGVLQSIEICKLALGTAHCTTHGLETLAGKLWHTDLRDNTTRVVSVAKRPGCLVCSHRVG